jgi:cysteine-rich repeat protein
MTESGEVDFYSFTIADDLGADEIFILDVEGEDSGSTEFACILTDSTGTDVGTIQEAGTGDGCLAMSDSLVSGETYYLEVRRIYSSSDIAYTLSSRIETGVLESEPNDDVASATSADMVDGGLNVFGNIPSNSDVDVISFELAADMGTEEILRFNADLIGYDSTSASWSILDATSTSVASGDISEMLSVSGLSAGTYYLELTRTSSTYWYSVTYQISATLGGVVCGDGMMEGAETCDDGNTDDGDGCSSVCEIEPPTEVLTNNQTQDFTSAGPGDVSVTSTQCTSVARVTVDVDFSSGYQDELTLTLTSPAGTSVVLHDEAQHGVTTGLTANYPTDVMPDGPGSLADFIGEDGVGDWTLTVDYIWSYNDATFESFTVNLFCD